jgi:hypothetical protein
VATLFGTTHQIVLLDECLPERLKGELPGHHVRTAREPATPTVPPWVRISLPIITSPVT